MIEQKNGIGVQGSGCSKPLKGCAIVVAAVCFALLGLLVYLSQRSDFQSILVCRQNMTEVGQAVIRYYEVNSQYPNSLDDLKEEYLKTTAMLKCPEDKSGSSDTSYVYHKPSAGADKIFIMLECKNHVLEKGRSMTLIVTLDGTWSINYSAKSK
ncbi:MAG: hypothetical protein NT018_09960 [Armatimonadetes bacterium]|nr:hypothetical protein [Armatimonadota bacterium]